MELTNMQESVDADGKAKEKFKIFTDKAKATAQAIKNTGDIVDKTISTIQNPNSTPNSDLTQGGQKVNLPIENSSKKKWFIIGGGVILLGIIGFVIYKIKKRK
jgi:hypothetical protein